MNRGARRAGYELVLTCLPGVLGFDPVAQIYQGSDQGSGRGEGSFLGTML